MEKITLYQAGKIYLFWAWRALLLYLASKAIYAVTLRVTGLDFQTSPAWVVLIAAPLYILNIWLQKKWLLECIKRPYDDFLIATDCKELPWGRFVVFMIFGYLAYSLCFLVEVTLLYLGEKLIGLGPFSSANQAIVYNFFHALVYFAFIFLGGALAIEALITDNPHLFKVANK